MTSAHSRTPLTDAQIAELADGRPPTSCVGTGLDSEQAITSMAQEIRRLRSCRCRAIACAFSAFGTVGPNLIERFHAQQDAHHPSCPRHQ